MSNRITVQRFDQVIWLGVCPNCLNFKIVKLPRVAIDSETGRTTFKGSYYACGSEHGHKCWNMTGQRSAKNLYEVFGDK
jgi:hypothetical protein